MADQPTVLIAGITGGIGNAAAQLFAKAGWQVAGYSRSEEKLSRLVADQPSWISYAADARVSSQVDAVAAKILERTGRLDAYVHCVGSILLKPAHSTTDEEWSETLRLNLDSAFYGLRAAVRPMMKAGGGSIALVSTVAAMAGLPNHEAIAAAKAGINGLVRSAAATYAPRGVRVNAVAPGMVDSPMAAPLLGSEQARQVSAGMHPLGRIGRPEDIASLLFWLSGPEAEWVTGQVWSADGGMAALRQRPKA